MMIRPCLQAREARASMHERGAARLGDEKYADDHRHEEPRNLRPGERGQPPAALLSGREHVTSVLEHVFRSVANVFFNQFHG